MDDEHSQRNIGAAKTYKLPSCYVTSLGSTQSLPLDLTFYHQSETHYSLLEKHDIMNRLATSYPHHAYRLSIQHSTESLDLKTDQENGIIRLYLNGRELCSFTSKKEIMRIKFVNPDRLFEGIQNDYLPPAINENIINMSMVDNLTMIVRDCKITELYQNYYNTYTYPERMPIFSS